jgi:hypothetical protein
MIRNIFIITIFILVSTSAKSDWVQVSNGITQLNINDLTVSGNYIFAATNVTVSGGGIFRSSDNGNSWEQVYFTTTLSLASSGNYIYRGYQNGFSYSSNYGSNWITPSGTSKWINSILAHNDLVYIGVFTTTPTTNQGVWITSNNGTSWAESTLNNINIYTLNASGNNIFAGGYTFGIGGGVFKTTNNGLNWTNPLTVCGDVIASDGNIIYTGGGSSEGVYKSTNYGDNWSQTSLNSVSVQAIVVVGNNVFAGSFYVSTNAGLTWANRSEGMSAFVNSLCIYNGYLFAGTDGQGVWRRPISELVGINSISSIVPSGFALKQNYPNPFNPNTKIQISIPQKSFIQIKIFDVLGSEMEKILHQELTASEYEIDFNGSNYRSGVYFYQLISDGKIIDTKKFVIAK